MRLAVGNVPVQKIPILRRDIFSSGSNLCPLALGVDRITWAKKPAPAWRGFVQNTVPAGIGRPVGHTVLQHMDTQTRPLRAGNLLDCCAPHDLFYREVLSLWEFPMQEGKEDPD